MAGQDKTQHIIVIGGGLSANLFLQDLFRAVESHPGQLALDVTVIEQSDEFVGGIAWSEKYLRPFHAMNLYLPSEYREVTKEKVQQNHERLASKLQHKPIEEGEISRIFYGEEQRIAFEQTVAALRKHGVPITLCKNTAVTDVAKEGEHFSVTTHDGIIRKGDYVLVASGHWQHMKPNENKGIFSSPWPASRLEEEIDLDRPIAVMGSSLSAVDAILTLAHKAGIFGCSKDGKVTFTPHSSAQNFQVHVCSPHGMLPSTLGFTLEGIAAAGEFPPLEFSEDTYGFVSLDRLCDLLKADFLNKYVYSDPAPSKELVTIAKVLAQPDIKIEQLVEQFYKFYRQNSAQWHQSQLSDAKKSITSKRAVPWQDYLRDAMVYLEMAYNEMSAEDQERFTHVVRPLYSKLALGMVKSNAEEIVALMEGGYLRTCAIGNSYSIGTKHAGDNKLPGGELRYIDETGREHKEYYPAIVKASGDDLYKLYLSSPLMKSLYDSGTGSEVLTLYKDQVLGEREYQYEQQSAGENKIVRHIDGNYYRSSGGLTINPRTHELIPAADHEPVKNIFALGPPLTGQFPLLHGIGAIHRGSAAILNTIYERNIAHQTPKELVIVLNDLFANSLLAVTTGRVSAEQATSIRQFVARNLRVEEDDIQITDINTLPLEVRDAVSQSAMTRG